MPVEWPLAVQAADRLVEPARLRVGTDRVSVVQADFFLDEVNRLTDEERSLMAAMLRGLISDIADELIAGLPPLVAAQAEPARDGFYRTLRNSRLLERPGIVTLLLRRADEQQLSGRSTRPGGGLIAALIGDEIPAVAEAAMGLTVARGRRRDRFGRLGIEYDDLAAEDAVALVHSVAAVIRNHLDHQADQLLASSSQALLSRHDEGRRLEAMVAALARELDAAGRLNDELLRDLAEDRDAALLVGMMARRAGIDGDDAWDFVSSGEAMLLARLSGCERSTAAQILAAFDSKVGLGTTDRAIEQFDSLDDEQVERCRRWMRLDPNYRNARNRLEKVGG